LADLYATIHCTIGELMYAKNFYIALLSEDGEQLSFPYFVDQRDPAAQTRGLRRGLTEYVIRTGKPLLADLEQLKALRDSGEVELIGSDCVDWMGVPLK